MMSCVASRSIAFLSGMNHPIMRLDISVELSSHLNRDTHIIKKYSRGESCPAGQGDVRIG